jgi:6-phosphofructokinase 1
VLGTRFGLKAYQLVKEGKFGQMVALKGTEIIDVPLEAGVGVLKTVPLSQYEEIKVFFGL